MSDAAEYHRITRRTLHEEVLERLRDMIIEGRLEPGQRINEGQIGAQLGVSRTPLREAIKTLVSEGLKRFEYDLRRKVGDAADRALVTGSDEVPPEFRKLVEEYYRSLSKGKQ